jgi:nucleotide-binding universal stress UspA family protein
MILRDILVHVPDPGGWPRHLTHAAQLAHRFDARLTGIQVIEPFPAFAVSDAPAVTIELQRQIAEQVRQAHQNAAAFGEKAAALGVSASEWRAAEGNIPNTLAYAAAWHDLLVVGARNDGFRASPQILAEAVIQSGVPCLFVPEPAAAAPLSLDTIAIGWNGSIEALRAIHSALPVLRCAKRIVMLCGRMRDYSARMPQLPAFDLDMYLSRHDLCPERRNIDTRDTEAGHALIARAAAEGAGLLVMGAFGRSRFSEWVLGGATRQALWEGTMPLLLRH